MTTAAADPAAIQGAPPHEELGGIDPLARTAVTVGVLGIALAVPGLAGNLFLPGLLDEGARAWW